MTMGVSLDLARARWETPGCERVLHFDNAGAALMPDPVLNAVVDHLRMEASLGAYRAEEQAQETIDQVYDSVAELINGRRGEIALIENATRAWDMAFYAIHFQPGDRVVTAKAAYASNYIAFLQMARRRGVQIDVIPNDAFGQLSIDALRGMLDDRVRLVAITHVLTNGGLVNPAAEVGRLCRAHGILYLLDACQSVGQMPIDVQQIGCDMLSATGRKFLRGPRGTGFLYVRRQLLESLEPPFLDVRAAIWRSRDEFEMRPDARRFENWESHVAGRVGLGVAVRYALAWGLDVIWHRIRNLAADLRRLLADLPQVEVHDLGTVKCGIVTFTVNHLAATDVEEKLLAKQINVTTSTVYSTRLDMEDRGIEEMVRASVHYYNSEEEIEHFVTAVAAMA